MSLWPCPICRIIAKNKHISWTVTSRNRTILRPVHPGTGNNICLSLPPTVLYFQENKSVKTHRIYWCGVPLFVITHWDFVDYRNSSLTVCILSPLFEVCVSNVACVTVILSRNVFFFRWMCVRVWFWYQFPVMSWSVGFLLVNTLWTSLAHAKPNTFWLIVIQHLHCLACRILLLWHEMDWRVEMKKTHKHEPTFQNSEEEILTGEWRTFASSPILH